MAVTPLTPSQLAAVMVLVDARRIEPVPTDAARAAAFLAGADERVGQLSLLTSPGVKYDIAYDAAHDVGEALLAAHGYRTSNGPGQHEAVGRFLRAVLDEPPGNRAAGRFDRLRRARNQNRYDARPIGAADAALAEQTAIELLTSAQSRLA